MIGRTLRESITSVMGGDEIDESRLTITPQMKQELQAEEKKIVHTFRFDQFLNFDANLSGFRNEDYDQQTSWFFYFIDIIYVATIFNISHLITKCGEDLKVYIMAASYFTIMFTTRMFFDTFTSILHANGVLHTMIFILYGLGVYCMTVNIAAVTTTTTLEDICSGGLGGLSTDRSLSSQSISYIEHLSHLYLGRALQQSSGTSADHSFGSCHQVENFDFGFALSFLFTRSLIFVLFFLYCTVFHHVKHSSKKSHHHGDSSSTIGSGNNSIGSNTTSGSIGSGRDKVESNHNSVEMTSPYASTAQYSSEVSARTTSADTTTTHNTTNTNNATQAHKAHIRKVLVWKIVPLIISCVIMLFTFTSLSTFVIFPIVAIVEIVGDVVPELLVSMEGIKPDRHNLEERLGLMFMLVLGETMLGFLVQRGNAVIDLSTYSTLIPAYILVIAVGMQYFKNAQFPHLEAGKHPLDRPVYSAAYTWLSAMLSFLMLVAANGLVEIYNEIADLGQRSADIQEKLEMKKISVCLFSVWVIMLLLHLLEGTYWDVIVRSMWVRVTNLCCLWSKKPIKDTSTSGTSNVTAHTNPIHATTSQPEKVTSVETTDSTPAHEHVGRTSTSHATEEVRHSTAEPSRYPYSARKVKNIHRNSVSNDNTHDHAISAGDSHNGVVHEEPTAVPLVFNKRLFFLKLGVAFVHLYTHTFNIDAQYFVVVNAMVALVPQLAEAVLEFLDLRQRLKTIRAQLKLRVEAA